MTHYEEQVSGAGRGCGRLLRLCFERSACRSEMWPCMSPTHASPQGRESLLAHALLEAVRMVVESEEEEEHKSVGSEQGGSADRSVGTCSEMRPSQVAAAAAAPPQLSHACPCALLDVHTGQRVATRASQPSSPCKCQLLAATDSVFCHESHPQSFSLRSQSRRRSRRKRRRSCARPHRPQRRSEWALLASLLLAPFATCMRAGTPPAPFVTRFC